MDPAERLEIKARWQGDVLLDAEGPVRIEMRPLGDRPFRGPAMLRAEVLVAGKTQRVLTVTVDTRYYRPVLVATRAIRRGEAFAPDQVELAERDVTQQHDGFYTDVAALAGLQARRPIPAGAIVGRDRGEALPAIRRGDAVTLVVESRSMQIAAAGVAMQDAGLGQPIRVKNADSGKVLLGHVRDAHTVSMGE
jgi:flagella basal body P-ring formation protein FlgA